jgi:hypothetical protein
MSTDFPGQPFGPGDTISVAPAPTPEENTLEIRGDDGTLLLVIGPSPDYTWAVAPEGAPEAARIFAEYLSQFYLTNRFS